MAPARPPGAPGRRVVDRDLAGALSRPAGYGVYAYVIALSLIFGIVATLGLDQIVVRELVRNPAAAPQILGSAAGLRLLGGIAAWALLPAAVILLRPGDTAAVQLAFWIGITAPLQALTVIDLWFQARVASRNTVVARNIAFGLTAGLKIWLIVNSAPLPVFGIAVAAEGVLGALFLWLAYRRSGEFVARWRVQHSRLRQLLSDSWPLIFSGLLITLYLRIDQVMLAQMVDDRALGIYSAAVRLSEALPLIPAAIISSIYPSVVAARERSEELFLARLQQLYGLVAALGYAMALPIIPLAPWLIEFLLGPEYVEAAPALIVLSWAALFSALGLARSTYLNSENLARLHVLTVALGCGLNIGLNWLLIPRWGGYGAAWASLFAYWMAAHGSCYLIPALRPAGAMLTRALLRPKFW